MRRGVRQNFAEQALRLRRLPLLVSGHRLLESGAIEEIISASWLRDSGAKRLNMCYQDDIAEMISI
jgi:hypothetical protein